MKNLNILACFAILLCAGLPSQSQFYFYNNRYYDQSFILEGGISAGLMNAFTDLGGNKGNGRNFLKDLNFCNNQLALGLYGNLSFLNCLGIHLQFTHGKLMAYDSILHNRNDPATGRYERNLSFISNLEELALKLECYPVSLLSKIEHSPKCSPYILIGAGIFHFNPKACLDGVWHKLQPLHTEGQGFAEYPDRRNYSLNQTNWMLGSGFRIELNALLVLRFEFLYRILHTDYLDDVSTNYIEPKLFYQYLNNGEAEIAYKLSDRRGELDPTHEPSEGDKRGDPERNDSYFSIELKFGFVIGREKIRKK